MKKHLQSGITCCVQVLYQLLLKELIKFQLHSVHYLQFLLKDPKHIHYVVSSVKESKRENFLQKHSIVMLESDNFYRRIQ